MFTQSSPETLVLGRHFIGGLFRKVWLKIFLQLRNLYGRYRFREFSTQKKIDLIWDTMVFNRIALVNLLLAKFENGRYLEIGCAGNVLFNSVPVSNKIGVDPLAGGNHRMTSDEFFADNTNYFDVIFIDGLHTYEQIYNDLDNALKFVVEGGFILIHDMIPLNWVEQHVPNISKNVWTGDVWKVAFDLIKSPGIEFQLVEIDHGIGVVKKIAESVRLNDKSMCAIKKFDYFVDNYSKLPHRSWESFTRSLKK